MIIKKAVSFLKNVMKGYINTIEDVSLYKTIRELSLASGFPIQNKYTDSVWVFASVNAIAQNISRVPFEIYREKIYKGVGYKTKEKVKVEEGELYDLFNNPNKFMHGNLLFYATVVYMELFGEAFWVLDRSNITQIPKEIVVVVPTRMRPILDNEGNFTGKWFYQATSSKVIELFPYEVLHFKYFDPFNPIRGISPFEAAKIGIEQDKLAGEYNKQFFRSGVALSGIIKTDRPLSEENYRRLKEQFQEEHGVGYGKAHRVAVIENADFIETKAMSQKDMEFNVLKRVIREEILAAYKTNEVVLGIYSNIQCFHPETEILTVEGFKSVTNIRVGDLVASMNPKTEKVSFNEVTKTFEYDFDGEMFTTENEDFMVTPEHKLLIRIGDSLKLIPANKIDDDETLISPRTGDWSIEYSDITPDMVFATSDKMLAEKFFIKVIKCGFVPRMVFEDSCWKVYVLENSDVVYTLKKVEYSGKVYCLEVKPYHTVLTRFRNNIIWTGQSYEGIRNAHESFWKETIIPKAINIQDFLWSKFFSKINGGVEWGEFNFSDIEALRRDFADKVKIALDLNSIGYPINVINERLNLGLPKVPWGDYWWTRNTITPVSIEQNSVDEEEENEELTEAISSDNDEKTVDDFFYADYRSKQKIIENYFYSKLKRFFFEQRKRVLANLNSKKSHFDFDSEKEMLRSLFVDLYRHAIPDAVFLLSKETNKEISESNSLLELIDKRADFSSSVILTSLDSLLSNKNVDNVKKLYNKFDNKLKSIARTESASIINNLRFILMKENGISKHKWYCTKNSRHVFLKNKVVSVGDTFIRGVNLKFPCDFDAPASEVINCLCYTIPL